jgi:hypothetical protein
MDPCSVELPTWQVRLQGLPGTFLGRWEGGIPANSWNVFLCIHDINIRFVIHIICNTYVDIDVDICGRRYEHEYNAV